MTKGREGPAWRVERGDCVELLGAADKGSARLIVADPPYNLGMEYDAYDDNMPSEAYMAWTRSWLAAARHALHKHGSLWVFVPDEWVSEVDVMCRHEFKLYKRRHVVWAFTFGQAAQNNFSKSHCHVLYFTAARTRFTFDADAMRVPSARQLVYNDKRARGKGKLPDATWMLLRSQLEPYMTPDRDTWLESRICGTYRERRKHSPNQIPVPVMERIVRATSAAGDLVVDPFAGTGSCGVACVLHGRDYVGFDVSKSCVRAVRDRLGTVAAGAASG